MKKFYSGISINDYDRSHLSRSEMINALLEEHEKNKECVIEIKIPRSRTVDNVFAHTTIKGNIKDPIDLNLTIKGTLNLKIENVNLEQKIRNKNCTLSPKKEEFNPYISIKQDYNKLAIYEKLLKKQNESVNEYQKSIIENNVY